MKTIKPGDIEVIVRYRTPDGQEFDNLADALSVRAEPSYKLWQATEDGIHFISSIDECTFAYLPDESAVEDFLEDCEDGGYCRDGIDSPGTYTWDSDMWRWCLTPRGVETLLLAL